MQKVPTTLLKAPSGSDGQILSVSGTGIVPIAVPTGGTIDDTKSATTTTYSSAKVNALIAQLGTPLFTQNPTLSGTPAVGQVLTGVDGQVFNGIIGARQWYRGSTAISGATGPTYTVVNADQGNSLYYTNTATNPITSLSARGQSSAAIPPTSLVGYYANGATNSKIAAALTGVRNKTRRAKIIAIGDSTTVGEGSGDDSAGLQNAALYRPTAVIAQSLTNAGIPAIDTGQFGDGRNTSFNYDYQQYNPRITNNGSWAVNTNGSDAISFAGGGYYKANYTNSAFIYAAPGVVDSAKIVLYDSATGNDTFYFAFNGQVPDSVSYTGDYKSVGSQSITPKNYNNKGFLTAIAKRNTSSSSINLHMQGNNNIAVAGWYLWDSTTPAVDVLNFAARGAKSTDETYTTTANAWYTIDLLKAEAPDLTIIQLGLNDMGQGASASDYKTALQALITAAKISGDVLLRFPHPAGGSFNNNVAAFHAAAKQVAADNGVAFFSHYEYLGGAFTTALANRMNDGVAHPKRELYAELGARDVDAIRLMAPSAFA